jgi:hypothetical protein
MTDPHTDTPEPPPEPPPGETIAALTDDQAVQALALVVYRDRPPTPADPDLRSHLQQAARDTDPTGLPVRPGASEGDLARGTLGYLATTDRAADVERAVAITLGRPTERFDPATLIIGGLVLLALQTEISLDRDPHGRWRFRFHKQPMSDTTLGTVLGQLIGAYNPTSGQ